MNLLLCQPLVNRDVKKMYIRIHIIYTPYTNILRKELNPHAHKHIQYCCCEPFAKWLESIIIKYCCLGHETLLTTSLLVILNAQNVIWIFSSSCLILLMQPAPLCCYMPVLYLVFFHSSFTWKENGSIENGVQRGRGRSIAYTLRFHVNVLNDNDKYFPFECMLSNIGIAAWIL